MRTTVNTQGVPNLPFDQLIKVYGICVHCKGEDVFVAFSNREFWEHAETEHPETITIKKGR